MKISKNTNNYNRGYEVLRSQMLEEGTNPELKEGVYIGEDLPMDHPYVVQKKLNSGPNLWPEAIGNVEEMKKTTMEYYHTLLSLANDMFKLLALTLGLPEDYFSAYTSGAVATLRLLHYPPQEADSTDKLTRGIGAHTDFGAITLLMQDEVDGLQVWDAEVKEWFNVAPTQGAYVVNLGNLMKRWSNERYQSNLHRVINTSGLERYSIPFFFSGNPDYVIDCLPNCCAEGETPKHPPTTVAAAVSASYAESYGRAERFKAATKGPSAMPSLPQTVSVS